MTFYIITNIANTSLQLPFAAWTGLLLCDSHALVVLAWQACQAMVWLTGLSPSAV